MLKDDTCLSDVWPSQDATPIFYALLEGGFQSIAVLKDNGLGELRVASGERPALSMPSRCI
jgi:hypothetical protein